MATDTEKKVVFIGWSGESTRIFAEQLAVWIKEIIPTCEPWMSENIDKGSTWLVELLDKLRGASCGVLCVTAENQDASWMLMEAGVLAAKVDRARVCPLLIDITKANLDSPLSVFQLTKYAEQADVVRMMHTLARATGGAVESDFVEKQVKRCWEERPRPPEAAPAPSVRTQSDKLDEVVETVRRVEVMFSRLAEPELTPRVRRALEYQGRPIGFEERFAHTPPEPYSGPGPVSGPGTPGPEE